MKTSQLLKKVIKVLEENKWTKGALARNKYRHKVSYINPNACRFCAVGAMSKAGLSGDNRELLNNYFSSVFPDMPSLVFFNDRPETKKTDVISFFYRAMNHFKKLRD